MKIYFESIKFSTIKNNGFAKALPLDWKTEWPLTVVVLLWFDNNDNCWFFKHSIKKRKKKKHLLNMRIAVMLSVSRKCFI